MNVGELKKVLADFPEDMKIILSKDGEGNNYSPLCDFLKGKYIENTTWSGNFYDLDEEDPDGYLEDAAEVLCLWPTN